MTIDTIIEALPPDAIKVMMFASSTLAVLEAVNNTDGNHLAIAAAAIHAAVEQTFPNQRDVQTELIYSDLVSIANTISQLS